MAQRKSWSKEEDNFLTQQVRKNQKVNQKQKLTWGDIAIKLNNKFKNIDRTGKQCRQRWHNQLNPQISKDIWSSQEEKKLFQLQKQYGNKWALIASKLVGRTDNNVKNYFYSTLRKSFRKINSFILSNRHELKYIKEMNSSCLSKLLAVADHKFDKKINIKSNSVQTQAIDIKNLLIQIIRIDPNQNKSFGIFQSIVEKLQNFNKSCKKKKGKKKQSSVQQQKQKYTERNNIKEMDQQLVPQKLTKEKKVSLKVKKESYKENINKKRNTKNKNYFENQKKITKNKIIQKSHVSNIKNQQKKMKQQKIEVKQNEQISKRLGFIPQFQGNGGMLAASMDFSKKLPLYSLNSSSEYDFKNNELFKSFSSFQENKIQQKKLPIIQKNLQRNKSYISEENQIAFQQSDFFPQSFKKKSSLRDSFRDFPIFLKQTSFNNSNGGFNILQNSRFYDKALIKNLSLKKQSYFEDNNQK